MYIAAMYFSDDALLTPYTSSLNQWKRLNTRMIANMTAENVISGTPSTRYRAIGEAL